MNLYLLIIFALSSIMVNCVDIKPQLTSDVILTATENDHTYQFKAKYFRGYRRHIMYKLDNVFSVRSPDECMTLCHMYTVRFKIALQIECFGFDYCPVNCRLEGDPPNMPTDQQSRCILLPAGLQQQWCYNNLVVIDENWHHYNVGTSVRNHWQRRLAAQSNDRN